MLVGLRRADWLPVKCKAERGNIEEGAECQDSWPTLPRGAWQIVLEMCLRVNRLHNLLQLPATKCCQIFAQLLCSLPGWFLWKMGKGEGWVSLLSINFSVTFWPTSLDATSFFSQVSRPDSQRSMACAGFWDWALQVHIANVELEGGIEPCSA